MFDVDSYTMADAIGNSQDYKIVRSGPIIYVFPADTDFSILSNWNSFVEWSRKAVLVIDGDGNVRTNRFGAITKNARPLA